MLLDLRYSLSWGLVSVVNSCSLSSEQANKSGPSPHPPHPIILLYPGCTMSSHEEHGLLPVRLFCIKTFSKACCSLWNTMYFPMVLSPIKWPVNLKHKNKKVDSYKILGFQTHDKVAILEALQNRVVRKFWSRRRSCQSKRSVQWYLI